ncbi:MAG TPA: NUDIX domain-containing protein, partial [Tepidisphaeraceae bacterium]|nr:NUDIX domain-containing protein [Tepidisphaeraceae bacterium]
MRLYVCSFAFPPARDRVLLIRKNRPAWQAGKLNGVGGKIEPGETPRQAARREFEEETGLALSEEAFGHVLTLAGPDDISVPDRP